MLIEAVATVVNAAITAINEISLVVKLRISTILNPAFAYAVFAIVVTIIFKNVVVSTIVYRDFRRNIMRQNRGFSWSPALKMCYIRS